MSQISNFLLRATVQFETLICRYLGIVPGLKAWAVNPFYKEACDDAFP